MMARRSAACLFSVDRFGDHLEPGVAFDQKLCSCARYAHPINDHHGDRLVALSQLN
jgi:hypothetical protein